jgi:hypothetical protein
MACPEEHEEPHKDDFAEKSLHSLFKAKGLA